MRLTTTTTLQGGAKAMACLQLGPWQKQNDPQRMQILIYFTVDLLNGCLGIEVRQGIKQLDIANEGTMHPEIQWGR